MCAERIPSRRVKYHRASRICKPLDSKVPYPSPTNLKEGEIPPYALQPLPSKRCSVVQFYRVTQDRPTVREQSNPQNTNPSHALRSSDPGAKVLLSAALHNQRVSPPFSGIEGSLECSASLSTQMTYSSFPTSILSPLLEFAPHPTPQRMLTAPAHSPSVHPGWGRQDSNTALMILTITSQQSQTVILSP